ncbi:B12-binding domain-containing radical SAM protein [Natronospora cellulosivora (SeqCode)]
MNYFEFIIFNDDDNNINSWVSIGYLSSILQKKVNIKPRINFYTSEDINNVVKKICKDPPLAIGLPLLQHNFDTVINFAQMVKKKLPDVFIVLGNKEATRYYNFIFENYNCIDGIILGEGEDTLSDLCTRLINKLPLVGCDGLYVKTEDGLIKNKPRILEQNIDKFPFPDRSYRIGNSNRYNLIGSRGCVGNCTYCEANSIYTYNSGYHVRMRSIKNILDEIESILKKHTFIFVTFLDSTFCSFNHNSLERLEELYTGLKKRNLDIHFSINIRSEQVNKQFVDCLVKLKEVGLVSILIGIESGNKEDLDLYGKTATLDIHEKAIKLLNKNNIINGKNDIIFEYGFINFNPYTTLDKLKKNLNFIDKNNLLCYPYDLLSRLRISGNAAITKRIHNDGLLLQDINVPIKDPYAYRFKNNHITELYKILERSFNILNVTYFQNIIGQYLRYQKFFPEKKLFVDINNVHEYNKYITHISKIIFNNAIKLSLNEINEKELLETSYFYKNKLKRYVDKLQVISNRLSIDLHKIKQLAHF